MEGKKRSSISYTIYQYRLELTRPKKNMKSFFKTKVKLTDKLVKKSVNNLEQCSAEDLRAITREVQFKKKLEAALRLQQKTVKNKNSFNTENQIPKRNKSGSSKHSADCDSQSRDKERKHSSRVQKKSSSKIVSESSEHGSDDGSACGLNGFVNNCIFPPKNLQQETKTISLDQHRSTLFPEFLSETDDFLNLWNEGPDKETILLSEKFVYPDAKNTGKQMNNTVSPSPSSNHKLKKPNIDFNEAVKAEEEIKRARELHSRKRIHSTMLNESKKSRNDQTKPKKSSSKHSLDKGSPRKPEAKSSKQKSHKKDCNEISERMLELFDSCSSDEE